MQWHRFLSVAKLSTLVLVRTIEIALMCVVPAIILRYSDSDFSLLSIEFSRFFCRIFFFFSLWALYLRPIGRHCPYFRRVLCAICQYFHFQLLFNKLHVFRTSKSCRPFRSIHLLWWRRKKKNLYFHVWWECVWLTPCVLVRLIYTLDLSLTYLCPLPPLTE